MRYRVTLLAAGLFASTSVLAADGVRFDDGIGFYVGIDGRPNVIGGGFDGLSNPNANRLTFLLDHGDHYHSIGSWGYSGTPAAPVIDPTNANNRIPETFTGNPPIALQWGTGAYAGKWISQVLPSGAINHDYSHLGVASTQSLAGGAEGPVGDVLFNSSSGRWSGTADDVIVGIKLLNATPGLKVGVAGDWDIFDGGDTYSLGAFDKLEFLPKFWVADSYAAGTYSASFMLVNLGTNDAVLPSGTFYIDTMVPVPEPETYVLLLAGLGAVGFTACRRRRDRR